MELIVVYGKLSVPGLGICCVPHSFLVLSLTREACNENGAGRVKITLHKFAAFELSIYSVHQLFMSRGFSRF